MTHAQKVHRRELRRRAKRHAKRMEQAFKYRSEIKNRRSSLSSNKANRRATP